eukprot:5460990-Amphidinium_carterae.1
MAMLLSQGRLLFGTCSGVFTCWRRPSDLARQYALARGWITPQELELGLAARTCASHSRRNLRLSLLFLSWFQDLVKKKPNAKQLPSERFQTFRRRSLTNTSLL